MLHGVCLCDVCFYIYSYKHDPPKNTHDVHYLETIQNFVHEKMYILSHCHKINILLYSSFFDKKLCHTHRMYKNTRGEIHYVFIIISHAAIFNCDFNHYIINFRNSIRYDN